MTDSLRVYLIDDHPLVVAGLTQAMSSLDDIMVVGTANSAESGLAWLAHPTSDVDVVIVDVSLPGLSGIDLVRMLSTKRPAVRCIVLSAADDADTAKRALSAGAAGYLIKDISMQSLVSAVRAAAAGQFSVDPRVARDLVTPPELSNVGPLSDSEQEVLRLVADGLSNVEIGNVINAAPSTVKARISRLLTKLDARTRAEAVAIAAKGGLL